MFAEAVVYVGLQPSEYHALTFGERDAIFKVANDRQRRLNRRR